jgi:hypothetical protein
MMMMMVMMGKETSKDLFPELVFDKFDLSICRVTPQIKPAHSNKEVSSQSLYTHTLPIFFAHGFTFA